jgi:hypothetical protein
MSRVLPLLILVAVLSAGCGSATASPTIAPTGTPAAGSAPVASPTVAPTVTLAPTPTPSPTAAPTPTPLPTPWPTGVVGALAFVHAYEDALIAGRYAEAWAMLGPEWQAAWSSESAYETDRATWIKSAGPKYTATANPKNMMSLADWVSSMQWPAGKPSIDMVKAVLVEVDWAKLAGDNAGFEMWVVNPVPKGWELFEVR